jgi:hypothetical protein
MKRNSEGNLSWFATLVPKHELYLDGTAVIDDQYVLSIVVLNQRPRIDLATNTGTPMYFVGERVLGADFDEVGGVGYAGGELLLTWSAVQDPTNDKFAQDTMLNVRAGDWIMLAKNLVHRNGTPLPIFRWYRITEADTVPEYHAAEGHYALAVSLSGQDWEVNPTADDTFAIVVSGVVGVYEKTVRLETF